MTGHALFQSFLQRWGRYLLPVLLILVGAYILADTRTDTLGPDPTEGIDVAGAWLSR